MRAAWRAYRSFAYATARARFEAALGRPDHARQAAAAILTRLSARKDELAVLVSHVNLGVLLMIPFLLDDRETRKWYEAEIAGIIGRVDEAMGAVPPLLNRCPLLIVTGEWAEARALWAQRSDAALTAEPTANFPYVGAVARAQGEMDEAWALVNEGLPSGLRTEPGSTHFTAVDLYCLAARLALDAGDYALARQWLEAHDRWLDWAGPEVCWGRRRAARMGGVSPSWASANPRCVTRSRLWPRHPLRANPSPCSPPTAYSVCWQRKRGGSWQRPGISKRRSNWLMPVPHPTSGHSPCWRWPNSPPRRVTGRRRGGCWPKRAICTPLDAQSALARATRLAVRLIPKDGATATYPAGLSPREVEVLPSSRSACARSSGMSRTSTARSMSMAERTRPPTPSATI